MSFKKKETETESVKETLAVAPAIAQEPTGVEVPKKVLKPKEMTPPRKQFELSDDNLTYLGKHNYSKAAWEVIARLHSIDPTTTERVSDDDQRTYLAVAKIWPKQLGQTKQGPLTTGAR